jgi:hypothetical protein
MKHNECPGIPSSYKYPTIQYRHFAFTFNHRKEERLAEVYEQIFSIKGRVLLVGEIRAELNEFIDYLKLKDYLDF